MARELVPFVALSICGLVASTIAVQQAAHLADRLQLATLGRTALVEGANVAAFGSLWVVQFVVLDRVLFRRSDGTAGSDVDRPSMTPARIANVPYAAPRRS